MAMAKPTDIMHRLAPIPLLYRYYASNPVKTLTQNYHIIHWFFYYSTNDY